MDRSPIGKSGRATLTVLKKRHTGGTGTGAGSSHARGAANLDARENDGYLAGGRPKVSGERWNSSIVSMISCLLFMTNGP